MFVTEPPPADNPLVGRDDVICTPHLGASTTEAQEDVSIEVAEVVVSALKVRVLPDTPRAARDWMRWTLDSLHVGADVAGGSLAAGVQCNQV